MRGFLLIIALLVCPALSLAQTDAVIFSSTGGFYDEPFKLALHCSQGNHIHYTTNGDTPTPDSFLYSDSLWIDESLFSKSNIYTIINCVPGLFYLPDDVQRAIVIRAAVFNNEEECISPVTTNSFFIHSLGCGFHGMPVISIVADSLALFDYETGIFIPGVFYDPADSLHTGNYYQKGREWERLINLEFYETDNSGVNQPCGLRIHGGASRQFQQKGMRFYAREEYGKKRFKHRFFESTSIASFKHLNLHPFRCSHWLQTGGQEYLSQTVASNLDIETLAVRQVIVFINGEYWGIYTLEESPDERYLEDHYHVDLEQVNVIKYWGLTQHGDGMDWWIFYNWMKTADLNQPEDLTEACSHVDTSNFTDYILFETFSANLDWPQNNTMEWQPQNEAPFRWILYDCDGCFTSPTYKAVQHALEQDGSSLIIQRFLESASFRNTFHKRYKQLLESYFSPTYLQSVLNQYRQTVEGEIAAQSERFLFPESVSRWVTDLDKAAFFFTERPLYFNEEILGYPVDESFANTLICSPNPSNGCFSIRCHSESQCVVPVEIFDAVGRKVLSQHLCLYEGENNIPFQTNLEPGIYFIRINHNITSIIIQSKL